MSVCYIGGISEKEALEVFESLQFFDKDLNQLYTVPNFVEMYGGGLLNYAKYTDRFAVEEYVVRRLRRVKEVLDLYGDEAIDRYEQICKKPSFENHKSRRLYDAIKTIIPESNSFFVEIQPQEFKRLVNVLKKSK